MLEDGSTEFHVVGPDLRKGHQCSCISQAAHSTPHV
jgi:hypothetical protein